LKGYSKQNAICRQNLLLEIHAKPYSGGQNQEFHQKQGIQDQGNKFSDHQIHKQKFNYI
jgi:hypothetical protein